MQFSLVGIKVTVDASQFILQMPKFLRLTAVILGKVFCIVYLAACLALFGFLVHISYRILFG